MIYDAPDTSVGLDINFIEFILKFADRQRVEVFLNVFIE